MHMHVSSYIYIYIYKNLVYDAGMVPNQGGRRPATIVGPPAREGAGQLPSTKAQASYHRRWKLRPKPCVLDLKGGLED